MGSAKACQNTENKEPAIAGFYFVLSERPIRGLSADYIVFDEWSHLQLEGQGRRPGRRFWITAAIILVLVNAALITYLWKFAS